MKIGANAVPSVQKGWLRERKKGERQRVRPLQAFSLVSATYFFLWYLKVPLKSKEKKNYIIREDQLCIVKT